MAHIWALNLEGFSLPYLVHISVQRVLVPEWRKPTTPKLTSALEVSIYLKESGGNGGTKRFRVVTRPDMT